MYIPKIDIFSGIHFILKYISLKNSCTSLLSSTLQLFPYSLINDNWTTPIPQWLYTLLIRPSLSPLVYISSIYLHIQHWCILESVNKWHSDLHIVTGSKVSGNEYSLVAFPPMPVFPCSRGLEMNTFNEHVFMNTRPAFIFNLD